MCYFAGGLRVLFSEQRCANLAQKVIVTVTGPKLEFLPDTLPMPILASDAVRHMCSGHAVSSVAFPRASRFWKKSVTLKSVTLNERHGRGFTIIVLSSKGGGDRMAGMAFAIPLI